MISLTVIRLISLLVPSRKRMEWKDEWEAELCYASHRLNRVALVLRCGGALIHAMWLRQREWRLEMLIQDITYALRTLLKKPAFTTVVISLLAIGIGANTAIFSIVYSVLLRPLSFKDPDRLVMVFSHNTRQQVSYSTLSADDLIDFQKQNDVFDGLASVTPRWGFVLTINGEAEQVFGKWVSANFFDVVRTRPQIGRTFTPDEDKAGGVPAVILSYESWQRRFGGDPNVLNKSLILNGAQTPIVGVMPRGFRFIDDSELWVPGAQNPISTRGRNVRYLNSIARLKSGVSIEQADASIRTIASRLEAQYPATNTGFTTDIRKLLDHITGDTRPTLMILLAAVGLVLLIACANVANLMLVRGADRQREVAVRTALGADRARLIKQFLTESVLLSVIGATAGLLLAQWGIRFLISLGPNLPRLTEIRIDGSVLVFTLFLAITTGVVFGLFPAVQSARSDLSETLKEGGRGGTTGVVRHRFRKTLVVLEVALALVLLVGSGLLLRSFVRLLNVDPGFRTENLVVVNMSVPAQKYPQPEQRQTLYYQVEDKLKTLPGVISVGASSRIPLASALGSTNITSFFTIEEKPVAAGERPEIDYRVATADYFETMGIAMIRGRKFTRQDTTQVAIINQAAARKFWGDEDPIGRRVSFGNAAQSPWVTIIGIVGNIRHMGLEIDPRPEIYRPYGVNPLTGPWLVVHTAGDPNAIAAALRSEIRSIENQMPLLINTIDELVDLSVAQRRFSMLILGIFAGVAMVLAIAGIYGVMSYTVSQRTHEIGLRMALGAETRQVESMVVREGLLLSSLGVAIGVAGAIAGTRAMSTMLFGITHTDPLTYLGVAAVLLAVALVASYFPARRASRVDPLVALRHE